MSETTVHEDIAALDANIAHEADGQDKIEAWRAGVDERQHAAQELGRAVLPRLSVDHQGVVMTRRDVAEMQHRGSDQDRTR